MTNRLAIPTVAICFSITGCSTVLQSQIPLSRFDNPEALGKSHGEFFMNSIRTVKVTHVPDIDEDPPQLNAVALDQGSGWSAGWGHGLLERWDLQLSYPWFARSKFQLLGANREAAKKNNFSVSIGIGGGVRESVADDVEFDEDSNRGEMDLTLAEASLMAGWRPWDSILVSSSIFAQDVNGRGKLRTENSTTFRLSQNGQIKGWSAGLHFFFAAVVLSADYTRSDINWSNGADSTSFDSFAGRLTIRY
jgi:hypothetical protein